MKRDELRSLLDERVLVCDGGFGTELYKRGVFINRCYDETNISAPALVERIHRDYAEAGADILTTNTFGANAARLEGYGLRELVEDLNYKGARLARRVADEADRGGILVAGSVGPLGIKIEPWGPTSFEEARAMFEEQVRALLDGGVDLVILETFTDLNEIRQAIAAVRRCDPDIAVIAQMTVGLDGMGMYGTSPETFAVRLAEWGADVVGLNCTVGPEILLEALEKMASAAVTPLSAQPNAGIPRNVDGRNFYMCSPEYIAEYGRRFVKAGASIVGGCCGTGPEHIRALASMVRALRSMSAPQHRRGTRVEAVVSSSSVEHCEEVPLEEKSNWGSALAAGRFVTSVELTPPRGLDATRFVESALALEKAGVDAVNIPDGPRASARMSPLAAGVLVSRECTRLEPILHYCCRDRNILGIQSDLMGACALGIRNLLLITGDPPKLGDYPDATAVFDVDSIGLTNIVKRLNQGLDLGENPLGSPAGFCMGVGVNPGAPDPEYELERFAWKVKAGAEFCITQPVFDVELLERFVETIRERGLWIPVIAGIWPLTSYRNAQFMNNEVPGARVPEEIMRRMESCRTRKEARREGVAIARSMLARVRGLVSGVQVSAPFGRVEAALEVMSDVL